MLYHKSGKCGQTCILSHPNLPPHWGEGDWKSHTPPSAPAKGQEKYG